MSQRWSTKFELKPGTWVFVPTAEAVTKGREIKRAIQQRWKKIPKYYYHMRDGGHVAALRSHVGSTSFIHLDIKNFFGSINRTRVTRSLKQIIPYKGASGAREWAVNSTVVHPNSEPGKLKYILPFGFVQSPIIASLCLHDSALGQCLERLHKQEGITISVYVDDLIISTDDDELSHAVLAEVKRAADRSGFTLNADKEEGPAHSITAFNIELKNKSLLIEPSRLDEFLEAIKNSESKNQVEGIVGYIRSVNDAQVEELSAKLFDDVEAPPAE